MCVTFKALNDERERYLSLSSPLLLSQLFHFASSFAALTADSMITITFSSVHNVIKSQCLKYVFNIILVVIQPLLTLTDICWRSLLLPYWIPFSLSTKIPFSFAKMISCKKDEERDFNLLIGRCLMSMCITLFVISIFSILLCHLNFYIFPIIDSHHIFLGSNTATYKPLADIQINRKLQSYVLITQHESRIHFMRKLKTCQGYAQSNHGPLDLHSNALPLSYIPKYYDEQLQNPFYGHFTMMTCRQQMFPLAPRRCNENKVCFCF